MHEMQADLRREKTRAALIFLAVAATVVLADQASKLWVLGALKPEPASGLFSVSPRTVVVVPGLVCFQYAENTGSAFSLFTEHPGLLTAVSCILALAILVWSYFLPSTERLSRTALAMVFGGAVGNLIDRFRLGYVVDFIVVHWKDLRWPPFIPWPSFNVADSAICVGIGVFLLATWLSARRGDADAASAAEAPEPE